MTCLRAAALPILVLAGAAAGCQAKPEPEKPSLAPIVQKKGRALSIGLYGAERVHANDWIDILAVLKDPTTGETMTMTIVQKVVVLDALPPPPASADGDVKRTLSLLVLPEEAEILIESMHAGVLFATIRNPEDIDIQEERGRATLSTVLTGERINTLLKKRTNTIQIIKGTSERGGGGGEGWGGGGPGGSDHFAALDNTAQRATLHIASPPPKPTAAPAPEAKPAPGFVDVDASESAPQTPAPTRSWFPESFLFQPLVATDADGRAAVNVPIPDRLTTWRVLALAHSADGHQAGAVDEFAGTLPAYVDPVVPGFLLVGDEVKLPLQVVNTTEHALHAPLSAESTGADLDFATRAVDVPGGGGTVAFATLRAPYGGTATLKATLGTSDAVAREIPVKPSGKPYSLHFGGTLGSPRILDVTTPTDLDPETAHLHVMAFPGALALLRSELAAASQRSGPSEDAYALWLAGRAPELFRAVDDAPSPEALRTLTLVETQRVVREARSPDVATASALTEAAGQHPESPMLARLTQRLASQVARGQRPDGTFLGGNGWTLQQVLVASADCVRAVAVDQHDGEARQRAELTTLRAGGAFERNLARIQDGYTAAVVLDSGAVQGSAAVALRSVLRAAIVQNPDGSRSLPVTVGVVRSDGRRPSAEEATARAVLALEGDDPAGWRADLGASLLSCYTASVGWGDGPTNRVALRAVAQLFRQAPPTTVQVSVELDGKEVAQGELSGARLKDVLALDAAVPGIAGAHQLRVKAEPPVAGLGFALELQGSTPWVPETDTGLELEVTVPPRVALNQPTRLELAAHGPAGYPLKIHQALPAGVQPVTASLDKLIEGRVVSRYHVGLGTVDLELDALTPGKAFAASYEVVATLAGTLHAPASSVGVVDRPAEVFHLPPQAWTIE